jgi:hypothetical protein
MRGSNDGVALAVCAVGWSGALLLGKINGLKSLNFEAGAVVARPIGCSAAMCRNEATKRHRAIGRRDTGRLALRARRNATRTPAAWTCHRHD